MEFNRVVETNSLKKKEEKNANKNFAMIVNFKCKWDEGRKKNIEISKWKWSFISYLSVESFVSFN